MLVDGYGLIFRAYHAIQSSMSTSSGELTNAVYGFASMLFNLLNNLKPDYAVVALEGGRTFRHEAFEDYKAHRGEMPNELRGQVKRIRELVEVLNIPIIERDGYEADDVIGSLAASCPTRNNLHVVVLTGDTDLLQLVDDSVEVFLPGARRFDELRRYDREAVVERYGFGPEFVADFKALVGDTSDNIPGVPGIGAKTASALIQTYGDIEQIFSKIDEVTPARAQKALSGNEDLARKSKDLATIVRDLEIEFEPSSAKVGNFDRDGLVVLLQELEFRSLLARAPNSTFVKAEPVSNAPAPIRTVIEKDDELIPLVDAIRNAGQYSIDVETTSQDPMRARLVGISIATSQVESWYIPVSHRDGPAISEAALATHLKPLLQDEKLTVVAHHGKYDITVLQRAGLPLSKLEFDTMIAAYLAGETSIGLKDLAFSRLGVQMQEITSLIGTGRSQITMDFVPVVAAGDYACADVESTIALKTLYERELQERQLRSLFDNIEMPLVPVLSAMEQAGVAIDVDYLSELSNEIKHRSKEIEQEIYRLAGREFNINSTRQLAALLFEELRLSTGKRTKTGYSVDQTVLESLRAEHPIIDLILEFRSLGKLLSTYVDALPQQVLPETGRVHTSFNQTIAATGRLSSTNPNLQNIPIRTDLGRRVRKAFVADHRPSHRLFDDSVLVSADYSQIELRLMAHMSQEPFLIEAFSAGEDIHRATAALVYGVPLSEVTSDHRRVAKTVNFGLLYGMQAYGLSRDTGLSRADAQRFIDEYWARLPAVKRYLDETLKFGAEHGYVQAISGRRRLLPDLASSNGMRRASAERMAINMPVQGTAADIMKIAMIRVHDELKERQLPATLILQVHDELVLEVDRSHVEEVGSIVASIMENAYDLTVPLETDLQQGLNWDEMTEIKRARSSSPT
jgi:DNA polymerase I